MEEFTRIKRLPPYVFNVVNELKMQLRREGEDIIDLGMGNPDIPTPDHIVKKLIEAVRNPKNHRYSASRGIYKLRLAICDWYRRHFNVILDPDSEAIATIGAKEGLSHLVLATMGPGDIALVPDPTYPIHYYSVIIANADVRRVNVMSGEEDFLTLLERAVKTLWPRPRMLIISFPHNPTTKIVDYEFFVRLIDFARENNMFIIHDLAYADITFDGYKAPSILQVPGAKDVAVELYSMSKGYSMPGWRVGFCVGNSAMVHALGRVKSYLDYGMFQPIQVAAIIALNGPYGVVEEINEIYRKRRDTLVKGLKRAGWNIEPPKGTMFVWGKVPGEFLEMGSLEFSKLLVREARVAVSPGVGFGEHGEGYVRFALVENEHRIRQAVRGIKQVLDAGLKAKKVKR
ncbi:MAG: aminotransferase class I/II-fold pyridoxal phosphate-dependent enzyme [Deltaproteobacteria bacterium]|nr:aminotransferase class I/II-fold pyridoxal phosphate-dependent enzyme [Deltaproteobacteria bacterium]NIS76962.1 aminotransferase class I/II-fold pyridoxal phosphate-dependent enzyme [Deltaproteobacteria bacterium]